MLRVGTLLLIWLAAGCSSSMSRADFEKKYAVELKNARETLVAIQQYLDAAPPAAVGATCELPGAVVVNSSPPYRAGNLEVMSEAQLLHVLDPAREKQLIEQDRGQYKPPLQRLVVGGPLRTLVDPNHSGDKVGTSELKDVELSRGVTHVLVTRGGPDETQQLFLFDVKRRAPACSFAVTVEVPADLVEDRMQYDTRRNGVVTNRTTGMTHKRKAYFDEHMRLQLGNEVQRRFGI